MKRFSFNSFLAGCAFMVGVFLALFCLTQMFLTANPYRAPLATAEAGPVTIDGLVDDATPWIRKEIDAEVAWVWRGPAHRLAPWFTKKVAHIVVSRHGRKIVPALEVAQPVADHLFRPTVAAGMKDITGILRTPVKEFGSVAEAARADAGPAPEVSAFVGGTFKVEIPKP